MNGRKRKASGFRKAYGIYMAVLAGIVLLALLALWIGLSRYQGGLDREAEAEAAAEAAAQHEIDVQRAPQRAFEQFVSEATAEYWQEQWFAANPDSFDDPAKVTEKMAELFLSPELKRWKAEDYSDEDPAYLLKNGDTELAELHVSGSELDWSVTEVEMLLRGQEEASLEVPESCKVYCNGSVLQERFAAEGASRFDSEEMEEYVDQLVKPTLWYTYTVSGQLFPPTLTAEAPADCTLVTDEEGFSTFVLSAEESGPYQERAVAFVEKLLYMYMMGSNNTYGNMYAAMEMVAPNSQVYNLIKNAAEGVTWNTSYPDAVYETEAKDVIRWAENCLSVDVKYHAEGTADGHTNTEDGIFRIYFLQLEADKDFGIYGLAYK